MTFITWVKSILFRKEINEEDTLVQQRKEIERLKEEIAVLKEKFIVLPKRNCENITAYFYDENIEKIIIQNISEAKKELCIAVAWFTSHELMDEINKAKRRGVYVKVIISEAKENARNIYKLANACNGLKTVIIPKKGDSKYTNLMHNKYCIIDNKTVIDGSYNWSESAKYNLEHIIILGSEHVAKLYKDSFEKIYNNPKYYFKSYENNKLG